MTSVVFSDTFTSSSGYVKLLELNGDVMKVLGQGDRVFIKGGRGGEAPAVLVTSNKTYNIQQVESSNATLVCRKVVTVTQGDENTNGEGGEGDGETSKSTQSMVVYSMPTVSLQLFESTPSKDEVYTLLISFPYKGDSPPPVGRSDEGSESDGVEVDDGEACGMDMDIDAGDSNATSNGGRMQFSFDNILKSVRCSEGQLVDILEQIGAVCISGEWRIIDVTFSRRVKDLILDVIMILGMTLDSVALDAVADKVVEEIPECSSLVVKHCIRELAAVEGGWGGGGHAKLDAALVAAFRAEQLFLSTGSPWEESDFMAAWGRKLSCLGIEADPVHLKGIAIKQFEAGASHYIHFSYKDLPSDPKLVFQMLFERKTQWSSSDIEPYVKKLVTKLISLTDLLLKYTRVTTSLSGERLHSRR